MKAKEIFKFTEKCLYNYKANLSRIGVLKEELRLLLSNGDIKAVNYENSVGSVATHKDPVATHVNNILNMEQKIKRLEYQVMPISKFLTDISSRIEFSRNREYKLLLELFYFGGASMNEIAEELNISRSTLLRRRKSLVYTIAGYLGL